MGIEFAELEAIVAKGYRAKAFQNSGEYQEAISAMYINLLHAMVATEDSSHRESIWRQLETLKGVDSQLSRIVEDGMMAEHELEEAKND